MLSAVSKFFDPLGWAAPVVIVAKILMQQLWTLKCGWDDPIPLNISRAWSEYQARLSQLEQISIPRWIHLDNEFVNCELHGFSDASTRAYAAVVYLRVMSSDESVIVTLLTAKSKVAPIKTMSVPRLELSAALLLAKLMSFVRATYANSAIPCRCWTDSTITLSWLSKSPNCWRTFVANRVAEIQTLLPDVPWRHVPTDDNPADCASRGVKPSDLTSNRLWWSGPAWLALPSTNWPNTIPSIREDVLSEKQPPRIICTAIVDEPWELSRRYSSWFKLLRVTAYVIRFIANVRASIRATAGDQPVNATGKVPIRPDYNDALQPNEIQHAKFIWIKRIQAEIFPKELASLSEGLPISKASSILSLNPYLDPQGLIRVGGRLRKSDLPISSKHPIVLRSHPLLDLIINDCHRKALHAGSQLTLTLLREEYWILRARTTVRTVLYRCVKCARERTTVPTELMGDLPAVRVTRSVRAFIHTGIDYAGPILVQTAPGRGHKSHKTYIALFVCMTTKAIHLELVSDYTTEAFLAAFHRFVSRRGLPASIYSDNGTTFKGAERELRESFAAAVNSSQWLNQLAVDGVAWHFIPPAAPHFGGLWEAGVRSVKHHLKRSIGCHTLTFEELATLLCRIEACLNSRPIAGLSENIDDYRPLTPGHFLIGSALLATPEPSVLQLNENRLSRWQMLQQMTESFWRAWTNDYLHTLQQRTKWRIATKLAKVGQIVLLRNASAPPSHWELGRILECHPGDDGLTRVVTVATAQSTYKRPVAKLIFLPIAINTASESDSDTAGGTPL